MTDFKFRPAQDGDAAGLIALLVDIFAEYEGCRLDVDGEMPELRQPATYADETDARWWVVEGDGNVLASVCACPADDASIELKRLYVASSARRQGLGARLVELVEREAVRRAAPRIFLWTDTRFRDAHRLYERLGYVRGPQLRVLHDASNSIEYRYDKELPA